MDNMGPTQSFLCGCRSTQSVLSRAWDDILPVKTKQVISISEGEICLRVSSCFIKHLPAKHLPVTVAIETSMRNRPAKNPTLQETQLPCYKERQNEETTSATSQG